MSPVSPEGYRLQAEAAGGVDELARDPPGVVGGEKDDYVGRVGGFADAAEGVLCGDGGDEFGVAARVAAPAAFLAAESRWGPEWGAVVALLVALVVAVTVVIVATRCASSRCRPRSWPSTA